MIAKSITVSGRVQGVGFRYFVRQQARWRGILGEVCNLPDGSVFIRAVAADEIMQAFIADIKRGPAFSQVERMEVQDLQDETDYKDFQITY